MNFLACSAIIIREIIRTGVASLSFASLTQSRKMKEPPCINHKEKLGNIIIELDIPNCCTYTLCVYMTIY